MAKHSRPSTEFSDTIDNWMATATEKCPKLLDRVVPFVMD